MEIHSNSHGAIVGPTILRLLKIFSVENALYLVFEHVDMAPREHRTPGERFKRSENAEKIHENP